MSSGFPVFQVPNTPQRVCIYHLLQAQAEHTSESTAAAMSAVQGTLSGMEEIREAILGIKADIESSNIPGLQRIHLNSEKFSKFGPRNFERPDVTSTNRSEAAFFSSIREATYEVRDLKIDVFGDVGIATYYPEVSFVRDGVRVASSGRQTLVFLRTDSGWKLVHEHGTTRP